MKNSNNDDIDR